VRRQDDNRRGRENDEGPNEPGFGDEGLPDFMRQRATLPRR